MNNFLTYLFDLIKKHSKSLEQKPHRKIQFT